MEDASPRGSAGASPSQEIVFTKKDREIHEQGLVSVLKQIHDDLDAVVFDAYGWPRDLSDEEILERLVALNHERAAEEQRGIVRWLRPDFQNPEGTPTQKTLIDDVPAGAAPAVKPAKIKKQPWPKSLPERITAVRSALAEHAVPATPEEIAQHFSRARKATVAELLETLSAIGHIRITDDGRYVV